MKEFNSKKESQIFVTLHLMHIYANMEIENDILLNVDYESVCVCIIGLDSIAFYFEKYFWISLLAFENLLSFLLKKATHKSDQSMKCVTALAF